MKPEATRAALSHVGFMIRCYVTQTERKRGGGKSSSQTVGGGGFPLREQDRSQNTKSVSASAEKLKATFLPAREKQFKTLSLQRALPVYVFILFIRQNVRLHQEHVMAFVVFISFGLLDLKAFFAEMLLFKI